MKEILTVSLIWLFSLSCFAETLQSSSTDPATGAISWSTRADGVHFSLTQILPEQARAFYVNRGFTLEQIEPYASSCVYMTVLRNDSAPGAIHFIRDNWSFSVSGKEHKPLTVNAWVQHLEKTGAKKSSLVAFRWAQFPPEQEYEPGGDWNQGMFAIGLPPGETFDAVARWDINSKPYEAKLKGVQCAK